LPTAQVLVVDFEWQARAQNNYVGIYEGGAGYGCGDRRPRRFYIRWFFPGFWDLRFLRVIRLARILSAPRPS
jgi:hypothetical protein